MKCAVCFSKTRDDSQKIASLMAGEMKLYPHQSSECLDIGNQGSLGLVMTLMNKEKTIPFLYKDNDNVLAVSGAPIDMQGSIHKKFLSIVAGDYRQAAQLFREVDGAFACFFWDHPNRKFIITTDFLGFQPVYYILTNENFILASELKAMASSGLFDVEMDLAGWGAFISMGAHVGDKTSLKGVKRLEPASIYTFDPETFKLTQETYWKWPQLQSGTTWDNFDHQNMIEVLKTNIKKYAAYGPLGTVLLSGGYDSRFILALLKELNYDPQTLIVDHPDEHNNADGKLAIELAKRLRSSYEVKSSPQDFYSTDHYLDYLIKSEVATPNLYLFVANVSAFVNEQMSAVWEGVTLGYILTGTHYGTENFKEYFQHNLKPLDSQQWKAAKKVFSPKYIDQMFGSFKESLDHEVAKYPDDCAGVNGYAILNWSRNRTALNPCQVYANHTLCFLPGMCREFMNIVGGLPFEMKKDGRLYNKIFNQYFPQIADIPVCSGGQFFMSSQKAFHQWRLNAIKAQSRLLSHRFTQGLLRRINSASYEWHRSRLVDHVLDRLDLNHPDLNNEEIRKCQQWSKYSYERALLFYWQIWRWIMEGKIGGIKEELCRD